MKAVLYEITSVSYDSYSSIAINFMIMNKNVTSKIIRVVNQIYLEVEQVCKVKN